MVLVCQWLQANSWKMDFLCEIVQALFALAAIGFIVVSNYNIELILWWQISFVACFLWIKSCCTCLDFLLCVLFPCKKSLSSKFILYPPLIVWYDTLVLRKSWLKSNLNVANKILKSSRFLLLLHNGKKTNIWFDFVLCYNNCPKKNKKNKIPKHRFNPTYDIEMQSQQIQIKLSKTNHK